MNIVILAAGMGKRMRSRLPKVLQPIAGRPMLDHVLDATAPFAAGSPRIIVVGHGAEAVEARYADRNDVRFALQSPQLGTGHALMQAVPSLDKNDPATLVCLGDVPLLSSETIRRMTEAAETNEMVLLTVELENPTGYGRIKRAEGRPYAIVEEKDATDDERRIREVNTGIMLLPTARLEGWLSSLTNTNAQGEYYLTDVLALAAHEGVSIAAVQPDHVWEVEGVNSKPQLARLERVWQRVQADRLMDSGVTLLDPDRIDIRGTLTCGRDVEIDVGCVFEGNVVLADGVKVGANCVLKNVEVGEDTVILPFCHLEGARVGAAGRIGPYSRLRPGAELAGGNHIGNFVEVKKSVVGEGTKINHLAYVGDADVGARVNIGAGCITCNYDGVNKFRTVIGDDAFIGSDTQLIAPVKVGAGATIGAGTTLTREAPEGKLTLSRARQVTIEGWKRPVKKA